MGLHVFLRCFFLAGQLLLLQGTGCSMGNAGSSVPSSLHLPCAHAGAFPLQSDGSRRGLEKLVCIPCRSLRVVLLTRAGVGCALGSLTWMLSMQVGCKGGSGLGQPSLPVLVPALSKPRLPSSSYKATWWK